MKTSTKGQVSSAAADRLSLAFYAGVATIALAGQITGADKLTLPMIIAVPTMALLELGGVALAARADFRRRLGETALAARILSGFCAAFAVGFNWFSHKDSSLFEAVAFSFMSLLGYLVWLINSGDRRRDQLRAENKLPPTAPAYGLVQWLRELELTRRARVLALADPGLGLHGSLEAAKAQVRAEERRSAIAAELREQLANSVNPAAARIAVATYDLDQVADRLAERADYDGLTSLIEARMTEVLLGATAQVAATRKAAASGGTGKKCPEGCVCKRHNPAPRKATVTRRGTGRKRAPRGSATRPSAPASSSILHLATAQEVASFTRA